MDVDLQNLLKRVEKLEAEKGILDTLYAYGHCLDEGDDDGWVDCFTETGRWTVGSSDPSRQPLDISGSEALRKLAYNHSRRPEKYHSHVVVAPRITLSEDLKTASCASSMLCLMRHDSKPVMRVFGRYIDELECGADGKWRFVWRHAEIDASTPGLPPLVGAR